MRKARGQFSGVSSEGRLTAKRYEGTLWVMKDSLCWWWWRLHGMWPQTEHLKLVNFIICKSYPNKVDSKRSGV